MQSTEDVDSDDDESTEWRLETIPSSGHPTNPVSVCACVAVLYLYLLMDKQYLNDLHKLAVNFEGLATYTENAKILLSRS